jgi:thiosulfate/3-mercaptopyruvate sulfurtransferase
MIFNDVLVSSEWLEQHLNDDNLRVYDATVFLRPNSSGKGYSPESGLVDWEKSHIPGAGFLDLISDLSDQENPLPFTMPRPQEFASKVAQQGINQDSSVVLYCAGSPMWATRLWWMLRSIGFNNVAVLDGGWDKWVAEDREQTDVFRPYAVSEMSADPRPELWANKDDMIRARQRDGWITINALSPSAYKGEINQYGRPGHLPGSHNVYYRSVLNPETGEFLSVKQLKLCFKECGAFEADRVITYCGGGISATIDCLALVKCGQKNIAVYDGSMSEWVKDSELELKLGNLP